MAGPTDLGDGFHGSGGKHFQKSKTFPDFFRTLPSIQDHPRRWDSPVYICDGPPNQGWDHGDLTKGSTCIV